MSRKLALSLLLLSLAVTACAQSSVEARVKQIRQAYANRLNLMQNQPYDDPDMKMYQMTLSYKRMYPGTGYYNHNDVYYWTDDENESYMLKPTLYFVTSNYSMNSNLYRFSNEFLYDDQTEEPMFILVTTELMGTGKRSEYRFYFDKGKLIKQVPERIAPLGDDELVPFFAIDDKGRASEKDLLNELERHRKLFHNSVETLTW